MSTPAEEIRAEDSGTRINLLPASFRRQGASWLRGLLTMSQKVKATSMRTAAIIGILLNMVSGYSHGQPASHETAPEFAARQPRYRIQPSDVVEISFRFTPEFNQVASVQPDGFISLQNDGEVKIAGLTTKQAADAIAEKYSHILRDPIVSVILKEFEKPSFVINGEVAKPGRFDLRGDMTITDAIAVAGGFNLGAKSSAVLLFRRVSADTVEVKKINVKRRLKDVRLEEDTPVQSGDSIYVGESRFGKLDRFMKVSRLGLYFPIPIP